MRIERVVHRIARPSMRELKRKQLTRRQAMAGAAEGDARSG